MAFVTISPLGCVISKTEKQQQVSLNHTEWMGLAEIHQHVDAFMTGRATDASRYWCLPHGGAREQHVRVRVTLSHFEGGCYTNIRVYVDNKPSRQGVTLNNSNWASVQTALGFNAEAKLGRRVFTTMLTGMLRDALVSSCEGCAKGWSSQKDHQCVMEPDIADRLLRELRPVDECSFTVELAQAAQKRSMVLERPHDCYMVCQHFLLDAIIDEVSSGVRDSNLLIKAEEEEDGADSLDWSQPPAKVPRPSKLNK